MIILMVNENFDFLTIKAFSGKYEILIFLKDFYKIRSYFFNHWGKYLVTFLTQRVSRNRATFIPKSLHFRENRALLRKKFHFRFPKNFIGRVFWKPSDKGQSYYIIIHSK